MPEPEGNLEKFNAEESEVTTQKKPSMCPHCLHYYPWLEDACAAYPDGIPKQFLDGTAQHVEPFEGDKGIQYEPWREE